MPGSWSGDYGCIKYISLNMIQILIRNYSRYIGKVTVSLANEEDVFTYTQPMVVGYSRDLSVEQHLLNEGKVDATRSFFSPRPCGHVEINVWIPICGIAAGQSLPVLCEINNNSKVHFGGLVVVLTRIDIYRFVILTYQRLLVTFQYIQMDPKKMRLF